MQHVAQNTRSDIANSNMKYPGLAGPDTDKAEGDSPQRPQPQVPEPAKATRAVDPLSMRKHVTRACPQCRRRRVKCDDQRPCSACTKAGLECVPDLGDDTLDHRSASRVSTDELVQLRRHQRLLFDIFRAMRAGLAAPVVSLVQNGATVEDVDRLLSRLGCNDLNGSMQQDVPTQDKNVFTERRLTSNTIVSDMSELSMGVFSPAPGNLQQPVMGSFFDEGGVEIGFFEGRM